MSSEVPNQRRYKTGAPMFLDVSAHFVEGGGVDQKR